jgi:hypothetical protein
MSQIKLDVRNRVIRKGRRVPGETSFLREILGEMTAIRNVFEERF